jgi:SH3-like domain-containing protein
MRGIHFPILAVLLITAVFPLPARSFEYRAVESATVLYDTPSLKGAKLFVIRRDTPVEVIDDNLNAWAKVRDADGFMAWIEKKYLSSRRTVIVKAAQAVILQKPEAAAPAAFWAERDVSLDYRETLPGGWIRVRHRDGQEGYARASEVWGF